MFKEVLMELKNNTKEIKEIKEEITKKEESRLREENELTERIGNLERKRDSTENNERTTLSKGLDTKKGGNENGISKFIKNN